MLYDEFNRSRGKKLSVQASEIPPQVPPKALSRSGDRAGAIPTFLSSVNADRAGIMKPETFMRYARSAATRRGQVTARSRLFSSFLRRHFCRPSHPYLLQYLRELGIHYDEIVFGKPIADVYINGRPGICHEDLAREVGKRTPWQNIPSRSSTQTIGEIFQKSSRFHDRCRLFEEYMSLFATGGICHETTRSQRRGGAQVFVRGIKSAQQSLDLSHHAFLGPGISCRHHGPRPTLQVGWNLETLGDSARMTSEDNFIAPRPFNK